MPSWQRKPQGNCRGPAWKSSGQHTRGDAVGGTVTIGPCLCYDSPLDLCLASPPETSLSCQSIPTHLARAGPARRSNSAAPTWSANWIRFSGCWRAINGPPAWTTSRAWRGSIRNGPVCFRSRRCSRLSWDKRPRPRLPWPRSARSTPTTRWPWPSKQPCWQPKKVRSRPSARCKTPWKSATSKFRRPSTTRSVWSRRRWSPKTT